MNENELTGLLESLRRMGSDDLNVEVKESATTLSRDVWETVSAFANTAGGIIVLGVSERAGFVPVENFETEKVLNQFVSGMGDAGGRGKLANPPKYTIERVELQGVIVLVIAIEELDPSSKPCYVIERGAQGGSYKRIDDKDVPLSSTEVLALASYGRATPSDRDAVAGAGADNLDETLVDLNCLPFLGHEKWEAFFMRVDLRVKHDVEARKAAIGLFELGHGYKSAAIALSLPAEAVRRWQEIYRAFGSEVLLRMDGKQGRYTYEQKVAAASAVVDGGMTKAEAMAAFGIMSMSPLKKWCALYRRGGAEALRPRPKGRPSGSRARPRTREEELEERCRRLEAEVAYLKKLRALVERDGL